MLRAKFGSIWTSGFRAEDFWKLSQSELRIAHTCCPNKFYKGLPIYASCQVWFHLAEWFQSRNFFESSAYQNLELPMVVMFFYGPDEMNKLRKEPLIDASFQVWFHLAQQLQRRRLKCEKLMTDRRRMPGGSNSSLDPSG